eukprot:GABV01012073.1.p1 GENE.GABV01012073.1~~GABV01012073.1.p1  ORF type:complete len:139 (-),score=28.89 GABV01012073.1:3-419(-)
MLMKLFKMLIKPCRSNMKLPIVNFKHSSVNPRQTPKMSEAKRVAETFQHDLNNAQRQIDELTNSIDHLNSAPRLASVEPANPLQPAADNQPNFSKSFKATFNPQTRRDPPSTAPPTPNSHSPANNAQSVAPMTFTLDA